jgi:hypothetical protein
MSYEERPNNNYDQFIGFGFLDDNPTETDEVYINIELDKEDPLY